MRLLILLAGIVIVMLTARLANADDWVSGRQWGNAFTESPRPSIRERPQPEQKNAPTKASDFMFQELTPMIPQ